MTAPEDVGQAERRTAPGGGSGSLRGAPLAGGSSGYRSGPLNLIHRTKPSNPMPMRVTARFDAPEGLPLKTLGAPCPLSFLMGWRAAHGAKSKG